MTYDICVIGGGPGGYSAAIRGAQLGGKIALIERESLGGTCLNHGCIPTKKLYAASELLRKFGDAASFGIKAQNISFDFAAAMKAKDDVVEHLREGLHRLFKAHRIDIFSGQGVIEGKGRVRIDAPADVIFIEAQNIIVATGSEAADIPHLRIDGVNIMGNRDILSLSSKPESLLIVGGGVIGCEFANIFSTMGTKVTIVEKLQRILPECEREISRLIQKRFKETGIDVLTEKEVVSSETVSSGVKITLADGRSLIGEKALVSIGRKLNSAALNAEEMGIELENGAIKVNDRMETSCQGIYAVGDVTGRWALAHVAAQEGKVAAANAMKKGSVMDYSAVPAAVFIHPEIASVGQGEEGLKEAGIPFRVGRFPYMANGKALSMGEEEGFVKVLVSSENGKTLGVHIVGAHASDLIAEATLAMKAGLRLDEIVDTIHTHPTLSEALLESWEDVEGMAIHKAGRKASH